MYPLENIYNLLTSWGLIFFLTPGAGNDKTLPRPLLSELNYVFALTLFHILSFDLFPFSGGNTPSWAKLNRQVLNSSSLNDRHVFFHAGQQLYNPGFWVLSTGQKPAWDNSLWPFYKTSRSKHVLERVSGLPWTEIIYSLNSSPLLLSSSSLALALACGKWIVMW